MKKSRSSAILTTVVFMVVIFFIGAFATDAAYIVLMKQQLQKATEGVALEYMTLAIPSIDDTDLKREGTGLLKRLNPNDENVNAKTDKEKKEQFYRLKESRIANFNIKNYFYKYLIKLDIMQKDYIRGSQYQSDSGILKVGTEANVFPAFLRFIGINKITLHANASAKAIRLDGSNGESLEKKCEFNKLDKKWECEAKKITLDTDIKRYADFDFGNSKGKNIVLTNKPNAKEDFAVDFNNYTYDNNEKHIGFFIFGGYKDDLDDSGKLKWVDIGSSAVNAGKTEVVVGTGKYFCIEPNNGVNHDKVGGGTDPVIFSLNNANTKKLTRIRIYRTMGKANSPCEQCNPNDSSCITESDDRNVSLIILNHTLMSNKKEYDEFTPWSLNVCVSFGYKDKKCNIQK